MKRFFITLLLMVSALGISQTKEELLQGAKEKYKATHQKDIQKVLEYTYPKLLEGLSYEKSKQALESQFDNPNFTISWIYPNVNFKISEIKSVDDNKVAFITYEAGMRMTFKNELSHQDASEVLQSFRENAPGKNVTYESGKNSFLFLGPEFMIAISNKSTNNKWKYINYSKSEPAKTGIHNLVGNKVVKALGL